MNFTKLAFRNVFRNKVRLLLSVLGVAVTLLTFVTLHTAVRSWESASEFARRDRVVTRHKITFVMQLPKRYIDDMREAKAADGSPLVKIATFANWFGGKDPNRPNEFFATIAIEPETYFEVYDEITVDPPTALETLKTDRQSAIVGTLLAAKYGWKAGDRISLESPIYPAPFGVPWTFTIAGIYSSESKAVDQLTFFFNWNYLNDNLPEERQNEIGWIGARTSEGQSTAEVATAVDRLFDERDTQTITQDERAFFTSFMGMVTSVLKLVSLLSYIILLILTLILANATAMNVRERTNEYAAMKAIGFEPKHIGGLILGESLLVALLGGVPGIIGSYLLVDVLMGDFIETYMVQFFPSFRVEATTLVLALGLAVIIGLGSAVFPALGASRLKVTEALRKVA